MIRSIPGEELGSRLQATVSKAVAGAIDEWDGLDLWVKADAILDICRVLKETPDLQFNLLNSISAVDYVDHFELVYHLTSTVHHHSAVLKVRLFGRGEPSAPSVIDVWHGADYQEREIWDLMGINFTGHPNMKRIMLWEGFSGHPLRRDYLEAPR